ncbi:MAG: molybdopterin-synthase adenylyltransferase MoeB [Candidatus Margulisiibacteriota bacterium]
MSKLSPAELARYSRHLILPEVGLAGQEKLKASSVLLVGAGGLGSPLALYLAAAGVGRIGIIDFDVVDDSNLQRQIVHGTSSLGQTKLASAKARLLDLNPYITIEAIEGPLTADNALDLFKDFDVIADGTDNFQTRYLVNDACVLTGKSNVYGSIFRFEGQVSVFNHDGGPCYRCLYASPPPPGLVPSCAEGGVLGVLPGMVGTIQANEVLKVLLGIGKPASGRLLMIDALSLKFRELKLRKDPDCPLCSDHPTQTGLIDYQVFCGITTETTTMIPELSVHEYSDLRNNQVPHVLVDVREDFERDICTIEGSVHIPLGELANRTQELDPNALIIVQCKSGGRSARATQHLLNSGFNNVRNLAGGINAWAQEIDSSLRQY